MITGVCAPYNQSDCDYTIIIWDTDYPWGKADRNTKTLHFGGDWYHERDCWGMTFYEHEWYHMARGNFHLNGLECMLRHGMFRS